MELKECARVRRVGLSVSFYRCFGFVRAWSSALPSAYRYCSSCAASEVGHRHVRSSRTNKRTSIHPPKPKAA